MSTPMPLLIFIEIFTPLLHHQIPPLHTMVLRRTITYKYTPTRGRILNLLLLPIRWAQTIPFEIRSRKVPRVRKTQRRVEGML